MPDKARDKPSQKDPRGISSKRSYSSQIHSKRYGAESQNRRKRHEAEDDDDSEAEYYNFDKLKKFHIPRKKSHEEKELLSELSMESREYTHTIYPTFRSSFFDPQASRKLSIQKVEMVRNQKLESEYLAKKKDLKDEGRSEKDVLDSFGFLHYFRRSEVEKICHEGVTVGHSNLASLGKPHMGVYIAKHADIVRFSKWEDGLSGYIVMFKIMKGRMKVVSENRSHATEQEPTPLYDCHIAKIPIDVAQSIHSRAYTGFQYYLYEYGDLDIVQRPRQVLPYAVLKYSYSDVASSLVSAMHIGRKESQLDDTSMDNNSSIPSLSVAADSGFCHWRGKLLVKSGTFCSVEIRSQLDTVFNVASFDRCINVKTCLSLDKLQRQLPPTLMSRSTKKYNVIYRGRHYNTFTLHPMEEGSGLEKFRQLIALLVQESTVAFIPLRNNSTMYLLPMSHLTVTMGLGSYCPDTTSPDCSSPSAGPWKNFLHVIIITPKVLSSKINDQRVFNIVHARKRKDFPSSPASSTLKDALEQKLRMMNIEPSLALSSMEHDQYQKIYDRIKNKKRIQNSEKMLHTHYKESGSMPSTAKAVWVKNLAMTWSDGARQQQEFYANKKKLKVIPSPKHSRSLSKSSDGTAENIMDDHAEATFSDDEDSNKVLETQQKKSKYDEPPRGRPQHRGSQDPRSLGREDPRLNVKPHSTPYTPMPAKVASSIISGSSSSVSRPAFKPLEELIFCGQLQELLRHPEFSFSENYCSSHKVDGFVSSSFTSWDESHPPLKISFSQVIPYKLEPCDCPFASENDPIVLSMLRAIHGEYCNVGDTTEDHDKVKWVRTILHNHSSDTSSELKKMKDASTRQIENTQKPSPQFTEASPHPSSTDSGFVSSATPGNSTTAGAGSPCLKDIAAIIASALTKSQNSEQSSSENAPGQPTEIDSDEGDKKTPDMELAAKALLEVLAKSTGVSNDMETNNDEDVNGVDMELGSTPDDSIAKSFTADLESLPGDTTQKQRITSSSPQAKSLLPQGRLQVGKDPSLHRQSRPHFLCKKAGISQQEKALIAIRKIKPDCTMIALQGILSQAVLIMKEKKRANTQTTSSNVHIQDQIMRKMQNQKQPVSGVTTGKHATNEPMIMMETTEKVDPRQKTGIMALKKTITKDVGLQPITKPSTENQPTTGITTKGLDIPVTIGIEQWKEKRAPVAAVTSPLACSAMNQMKSPIKNFMTTNPNPVNSAGTPYSAIAPLSQNIGNIAMGKVDQRSLGEGHSSTIPTVTTIKPPVTPAPYQNPMFYGVDPHTINQYPSLFHGPDPYYPSRVPVAHPHYLVPVPAAHIPPYHQSEIRPVGGNIGYPSSLNPLGAISKQNTELLNSIISLMNRERSGDPRRSRSGGQHSAHLQSSDIAKLMPQVNDLLMQASLSSSSSKAKSELSGKSAIPPGSSGCSLSAGDIVRIREKKERLKAKRKNEKELNKREAMHMREELNKHILKHTHSKKSKSTLKPQASPTSSTHSSEGREEKQRKAGNLDSAPFSLEKPASSKVLESVASALGLSTTSTATTEPYNVTSDETLSRPTGIVTPKPRPVHPVFMEASSSFPLTELTSSQQSPISSTSSDNTSRVISEIDETLSVLKQEMQTNQNNSDLKDSMSKLLQLVIKLGGAAPHDQQMDVSEEAEITHAASHDLIANSLDENQGHAAEETATSRAPVDFGTTYEHTDLILNPAETPKDTIPFISDSSVIPFISDGSGLSQLSSRNDDALNQSAQTASDHQESVPDIDELLSKVRPAIETLNKLQSLGVTMVQQKQIQHDSSNSIQDKNSVVTYAAVHKSDVNVACTETVRAVGHSPTDFTTVPSTLVHIVRPQTLDTIPKTDPTTTYVHPSNFGTAPSTRVSVVQVLPTLPDIQPILSLAKNPVPMTVQALEQDPLVESTLIEREADLCQAAENVKCISPTAKSDCGTPTLDERYPDLAKRKKKIKDKTQSNSFYVFNPDSSIECGAICAYLQSVQGVQVNIMEMVNDIISDFKNVDKDSLDADILCTSYKKVLPKGTLWIVFRSDDISRIHLLPNIALLKAAGSHVQFVSANSVRDVRMRKYRNLLAGDGGIIVPLCPKTVLAKPIPFRHLLMWLIGQRGEGSKSRNMWKIALHQHILNALQDSINSDNAIDQENAQQVADWLCHANVARPRLALELPKHQCDSVPSTNVDDAWNWYDTAAVAKLAKSVSRCALKLQLDRVNQSRHVVLLIDGDPGEMCWHPIWQCGICVANIECFVERICSKHAKASVHPLTSCVLPLYKYGLPCLNRKSDGGFLEL